MNPAQPRPASFRHRLLAEPFLHHRLRGPWLPLAGLGGCWEPPYAGKGPMEGTRQATVAGTVVALARLASL